jgi:predicted lysophospholipase L1 biosynthesis ABC-type transport system permease subunit
MYVPYAQDWWGTMQIVARARRGDPAALAPVLRRALASVEPSMALADVRSLADSARRSVADRHYAMLLLSILSGVALALAALGIYGVTSYVFALRRRELGIRLALGATRANIYALVLRHGLGLTVIGLLIGIAGSAAAAQWIKVLLFDTAPADAGAWAMMMVIVSAAAVVACLVPARRAAGADPTIALRSE